jgi:hypothetical protein
VDGWMGGWMDGWESRVKDCLQQSKKAIWLSKLQKIHSEQHNTSSVTRFILCLLTLVFVQHFYQFLYLAKPKLLKYKL